MMKKTNLKFKILSLLATVGSNGIEASSPTAHLTAPINARLNKEEVAKDSFAIKLGTAAEESTRIANLDSTLGALKNALNSPLTAAPTSTSNISSSSNAPVTAPTQNHIHEKAKKINNALTGFNNAFTALVPSYSGIGHLNTSGEYSQTASNAANVSATAATLESIAKSVATAAEEDVKTVKAIKEYAKNASALKEFAQGASLTAIRTGSDEKKAITGRFSTAKIEDDKTDGLPAGSKQIKVKTSYATIGGMATILSLIIGLIILAVYKSTKANISDNIPDDEDEKITIKTTKTVKSSSSHSNS